MAAPSSVELPVQITADTEDVEGCPEQDGGLSRSNSTVYLVSAGQPVRPIFYTDNKAKVRKECIFLSFCLLDLGIMWSLQKVR